MTVSSPAKYHDAALLLGRTFMAVLFLLFGLMKFFDYTGTAGYMTNLGVWVPQIAAGVAIGVEVLASIALIIGLWTRPVALGLAAYTLVTALIGHQYWTMTGAAHYGNMIQFYKNVSIVGGFILLYASGAGSYSLDARASGRARKVNG